MSADMIVTSNGKTGMSMSLYNDPRDGNISCDSGIDSFLLFNIVVIADAMTITGDGGSRGTEKEISYWN